MTDNLDLFAQPEPPNTLGAALAAAGYGGHVSFIDCTQPHELHVKRKPSRKGTQRTIQEGFEAFHAAHPIVYVMLCEYLRVMMFEEGFQKVGITLPWEKVRLYVRWKVEEHEQFKLPNNYRSRYSRLIDEQEEDLRGRVTIAELRSE